MNNKRLILLFAGVILLCAAATVLLFTHGGASRRAGVFVDGELVKVIDLDRAEDGYELEITGPAGTNVITVRGGEIFVSRADCPDQICVDHGPLKAGPPIVCLPNRLTIRWLEGGDADAYTGI